MTNVFIILFDSAIMNIQYILTRQNYHLIRYQSSIQMIIENMIYTMLPLIPKTYVYHISNIYMKITLNVMTFFQNSVIY